MAVGDGDELAGLWRTVDELSADLPAPDRRAVRNAIANSVLEGHQPTADQIGRLVAFAAGKISMADYLTYVTQTAKTDTGQAPRTNRFSDES
ncbi:MULTISPECIES: antitoxin VbhA family protein [Mycobacterium]|uniref:Antitoxin VbhA domain-containing protein n=2 Tax=Mycobacterium TaxID=1763 RepID=A0AA37V0D1_9MYCO|nr:MULTISPECIES: antitoxin VbhA family protein [Mycobacterium]ASW98458.1 hypothetical protein CKJ67_26580 [Mycobacterium intracellulare]ELR81318.1 hypothetical protein W7U_25400 [Mycobacterium sp. H4Y]KDO95156.1 hypothetical protein MAV100_27265 [Mycobacterium avium subsp. hominissuis 100]MBG0730382.1 antitoxin VbhA family protein [Mycobacterium avium]MCA2235068.1 antitoxin VbhA family protein [Mycobacterium intracellulare]